MKALVLYNSSIAYRNDMEMPRLTSFYNVLVKVYYAGICRTDIGIAQGKIPAKDNIIIGHEFCGKIMGFVSGEDKMDEWTIGDAVSANPMAFGSAEEVMCGKECDGAFAEYIAVPSKALIRLSPCLLSPIGAFLEPVAAALAPMKHINDRDRICIFGDSRIADVTHQVALSVGHKNMERVIRLDDLKNDYYDCIIETEPEHVDAYVDALKPGGLLILKSRSFAPTIFTANNIAMKEIRIQGVRYGNFGVAHHLLAASANHLPATLDQNALFGHVYELSEYESAFTEASQPRSKKVFFRICAE